MSGAPAPVPAPVPAPGPVPINPAPHSGLIAAAIGVAMAANGPRTKGNIQELLKDVPKVGSHPGLTIQKHNQKRLLEIQAEIVADYKHGFYTVHRRQPTADEIIVEVNNQWHTSRTPASRQVPDLEAIMYEMVYDHDMTGNTAGLHWLSQQTNITNRYMLDAMSVRLGTIRTAMSNGWKMTRYDLGPRCTPVQVMGRLSREMDWAARNTGMTGEPGTQWNTRRPIPAAQVAVDANFRTMTSELSTATGMPFVIKADRTIPGRPSVERPAPSKHQRTQSG